MSYKTRCLALALLLTGCIDQTPVKSIYSSEKQNHGLVLEDLRGRGFDTEPSSRHVHGNKKTQIIIFDPNNFCSIPEVYGAHGSSQISLQPPQSNILHANTLEYDVSMSDINQVVIQWQSCDANMQPGNVYRAIIEKNNLV